jgi:hypothetical protein
MLFVKPQPLTTHNDVRAALQNAIRLEHATIPPYLTARATLKGTSESVKYARECIRDILVEEMLHMTLACNILNAIGGRPVIADAKEVPSYPGKLPMGVAGGVEVHLRRYSKALVEDTFMKIEEPEDPLHIPTMRRRAGAAPPQMTIGQFYQQIKERITDSKLFTGDPARQVEFDPDIPPVTDVASAHNAIDIIVQQGEGTPKSPHNPKKGIAHYYRFQQFSKGLLIADNPASPLEVSFDPDKPIHIDEDAEVIHMVDDPPLVTYDPADAKAETLAAEADSVYSTMLRALDGSFNGEPAKIGTAIHLMKHDFASAVDQLLQQQLTAGAHAGEFAGPRYRYTS